MRHPRAIVTIALVVAGAVQVLPAGAVHKFGDTPFTHVQDRAQQYAACGSAATSAKLKARALSISWNEVTDQDNQVPSPMTLSRWDLDPDLWWQHDPPDSNSPYRRFFWHPGIGIWQLDDAGMGASLADLKFSSNIGSRDSIQYIASQLCDGKNPYKTPSGSAWIWNGCNGGGCEQDYQQIYNGSGPLLDFDASANIDTYGGSVIHDCYWYIQGPPPEYFDCLYVKPSVAQGYDGWTAVPLGDPEADDPDDPEGRSPVALAFYSYRTDNPNGTDYEVRFWMEQDTNIGHAVQMRRAIGANSRSAGVLLSGDHPNRLCDYQKARCSGFEP